MPADGTTVSLRPETAEARPLETLRHVPLFRSLTDDETHRLDVQCFWRRYEAKQQILGHGEGGTDVFFVISGVVRALIRGIGGREVILGDIRAGEFFGELAAIDGRPRSASVVALTRATAARMPAPVFREAIHRYPDTCDQMLELIAARLRMLDKRVNEFSSLDIKHRVVAELLRLSRPDRADRSRAVVSPPPLHTEIAARVLARREAVTRELNLLERAGLLERRRGAFILTDVQAMLTQICDSESRGI
ncbi:MAG TPA: Crp/Fnr family transcriptional regulator [Candidatus Angelobacter sp.]|nr:Crp/Fnr family transcriptional regulator [Candidatus Angelobacter sp.]